MRTTMRILGALLSTAAVVMAMLAGPASVSANNDPHRTYLPAGTLDLPVGYCAFPVELNFPADREYATVSTLPDGSTVYVVTGSLMITATNQLTGKSISINAGGPGTFTYSPDGSSVAFAFRGRSLLLGTNLTEFGLPSNLVATAGPVQGVQSTVGPDGVPYGPLSSLSGQPQVMTDVCAALS